MNRLTPNTVGRCVMKKDFNMVDYYDYCPG